MANLSFIPALHEIHVLENRLLTSDVICLATDGYNTKISLIANVDQDAFRYLIIPSHAEIAEDEFARVVPTWNTPELQAIGGMNFAKKAVLCETRQDVEQILSTKMTPSLSHSRVTIEIQGDYAEVTPYNFELSKLQVTRLQLIWTAFFGQITATQFAQLVAKSIYGVTFGDICENIVLMRDIKMYNELTDEKEKYDHIRSYELRRKIEIEVREMLAEIAEQTPDLFTRF